MVRAFTEPYPDWNFKLMGRKFLLVSEPKSQFPMVDEKGILSKTYKFDVGIKFPRLGWVILPVDVVEGIPKIKHVYGKKIMYFPIWPWRIVMPLVDVAVDIYDRQMKLWKNFVFIFGVTHISMVTQRSQ